jgi:hypothetical protein
MPLKQRRGTADRISGMPEINEHAHLEGLARLSKELGRLDPYSFWVVPSGSLSNAGDLIVAGSTGLFLMAAWPVSGAFSVSRGRPTVDEHPIPGVRALRMDAKRLSAKLSAASVSATVEPVICLTHGVAGMPRDVKGVHVVALGDLIKDLATRPRILEQSRVERAARVLGVQIAGDRKRHFA